MDPLLNPTVVGFSRSEGIYNNDEEISSLTERAEAGLPTEQDYEDLESWKNDIGLYDVSQMIEEYERHEFKIPLKSLFTNYYRLASWEILPCIRDSERKIYYLVFSPKNKRYNPNRDFTDHIRKKMGKYNQLIITREIYATKIHYNVLVTSDDDKSRMHDTQDSTFYIVSKVVRNEDVNRVHQYIIKESKKRYFKDTQKPVDIYVHYRNIENNKFSRVYNN